MKRWMVILAAACAATAVVAGAAVAGDSQTTVIQPDASAGKTTFEMFRSDKASCANWGRYQFFHVGANALSVRRGLLQFDVASVPTGERIRSATLSVYATEALRGSGVVNVHRVTGPWAEGSGVNTCTNDGATWTQTGLGTSWGSPGGDLDPSAVASLTRSAGEPPKWDSFDVTALVRGWVSGRVPNYGLALKLQNEGFSPCTTPTNCNYWAYASDDNADASLRPKLTIVSS